MTAGSGSGQTLSLADWPVTFPCSAAALSSCSASHAGGIYVDATFGAGGYTRAILATPGTRVIGIDRDQSAIARGADLVAEAQGRLELCRGSLLAISNQVVQSCGHAAVDGVVFDLGVSSMQLDEPERGFSFRFDGPLDMRMGTRGAKRCRCGCARLRARSCRHHRDARRGAACPRHRARHRQGARRAPIEHHAALAEIVARVVSRAAGRHSSGDAHLPGAAHVRQRRARRAGRGPCRRRARAQAGGSAGRRRLPFARGPHRQDFPGRAQPARRRGSRHRPEITPAATDVSRADQAAGDAGRCRDRRQSARPLGQAARAERTEPAPRDDDSSHLLPRLPSLADILRGRP